MTLAADLAHSVCQLGTVTPGQIHDPAYPLVLGDQPAGNYCTVTWDSVGRKCVVQAFYRNPTTSEISTATYTFDVAGSFQINNLPISQLPAIADAVAAATAAAASAQGSADASATSAVLSGERAAAAGDSATLASEKALLASDFAQGAPGTPLPGGGNSAAVSAQIADQIATESRDLDMSETDVTASEVFQSGFLFQERQVTAAGAITITLPPGIFTAPGKKARWATYKLRSATGSVRFIPQAGGTNLQTPTPVLRGRLARRYASAGTSIRKTLQVPIAVPSVVDGEIVLVFHALHQGTANPTTLNFSATGGLNWSVLKPWPANASGVSIPDWFVARAPLLNFSAAEIVASFDEGVFTHLHCCDYWVIEGTNGQPPLVAFDPRTTVQTRNQATLPGLAAQSLVLMTAAQGATAAASGYANMSANLTRIASGNTNGIDETAVADDNTMKNEVWGVGQGVATAAGDFLGTVNWASGAYRGGIMLLGYGPKTVAGAGTVNVNYEGGRDTLSVPYGVAELWFHSDGRTVDVRTPKP